jgi:hypothetical protein
MTAAASGLCPSYAVSPSRCPRPPSVDLPLVAAATAERLSGLFARAAASAWGFRDRAVDAETLAIELVTRAVETTGDPTPH